MRNIKAIKGILDLYKRNKKIINISRIAQTTLINLSTYIKTSQKNKNNKFQSKNKINRIILDLI